MFKNMKIGTKLVVSMLAIGIIPMVLMSIVSIISSKDELEKRAFEKLLAVKDLKTLQIQEFFDHRKDLMQDVKDNLRFTTGIPEFAEAFQYGLESPEYKSVLTKRDKGLYTFMEVNGFYDVFLIDTKGNVVYTVTKESDLGENLVTGSLKNSGLGKAFIGGKSEFTFADYSWYEPSNDIASFISVPIQLNGKFVGVAAFQISLVFVNKIMQGRVGMGETGETYLVGPDYRMRSDSYLDKEGDHSVKASFAGTIEENGVKTDAVVRALDGKDEIGIITDYNGNQVLSAYQPIDIYGTTWVMLAEINVAEIEIPIDALIWTLLIIMGIIIVIVIVSSLFLAKSISNAIKNVITQLDGLIDKIINGKLDSRGSVEDASIDFKGVISGLNDLLLLLLLMLLQNMLIEYLREIFHRKLQMITKAISTRLKII